MDLLGDSYGYGLTAGLEILGSMLSLLALPFVLLLLGFVLYYFTGDKKKADEFMPKFMAQGVRLFSYGWLLIISITGFVGFNQTLYYFFDHLLPDDGADDAEGKTLTKALVLLVLMAIFAAGKMMLNRYSVQISKVGGTISTKMFIWTGMIVFSVLLFITTISTFMNVVDYAYDSDYVELDPSNMAAMFASLVFFAVFVAKSLKVMKEEK